MRVMLLAAGVGERMRPLTEHTPKPLLTVAGKPLLQYHVEALRAAGVTDLVVNVAHLGAQIEAFLGAGDRFGVRVRYSREPYPLETAGGIIAALPLLGDDEFLVVNGDVMTDYPFARLLQGPLAPGSLAHLVMVDSPTHHPLGDFLLDRAGLLRAREPERAGLTYAGIGRFSPQFFQGAPAGVLRLRPLLDAAIAGRAVSGEHFAGQWTDVGTPERLAALNRPATGAGDSDGTLV